MKIESRGINLYDTLFSGQCFRMVEESDGSFTVVIKDRVVNIKEQGNFLELDSNELKDIDKVVNNYLDLDRDYESINRLISSKNDVIKANIDLCDGYKILNQDKFEMFITYIISQNNNVKRIMGSVDKLSRLYGRKVFFRDKEYYLFPTFDEMKDISLEELKSIGVGFRDSYIRNALDKLKEDSDFLDKIGMMSTVDAMKELTNIKGIGTKVASCILLFGYGRLDTFPIDIWVRHFVSENFNIRDNIKDISVYMRDVFGEYSGIAIQYFYHIERNMKKKVI
jgi:N-glycosylase/DNA lyase